MVWWVRRCSFSWLWNWNPLPQVVTLYHSFEVRVSVLQHTHWTWKESVAIITLDRGVSIFKMTINLLLFTEAFSAFGTWEFSRSMILPFKLVFHRNKSFVYRYCNRFGLWWILVWSWSSRCVRDVGITDVRVEWKLRQHFQPLDYRLVGGCLRRGIGAWQWLFVFSPWLASTVNVPIVGGSASVAVEVEVEAFTSVQDTCTGVFFSHCTRFSSRQGGHHFALFVGFQKQFFDGFAQ